MTENNNSLNKRRDEVLCAGILVADIFIPPLTELPAAGELTATEDFLLDTGGCAANVAVSLAKLGAQATVVGMVGADVFGDFTASALRAKGVDTSGLRRSSAHGTSKTVILPVMGEDRRFIHTFGANVDLKAADIDPALLGRARVLYLGGYLILPGIRQEELAALFRTAREQGVRTVLDVVVPTGSAQHSLEDLAEILPFVDYFLPNDDEARALTGWEAPQDQAACFLSAGCGTVVITQGGRGTLLMDQEGILEAPAYPVEVMDSSGAGDAFTAGLILGILEGRDRAEAIRFASAVGASACTRLGCTTGVFTRAEAEAFVAAHPLDIHAKPLPQRAGIDRVEGDPATARREI